MNDTPAFTVESGPGSLTVTFRGREPIELATPISANTLTRAMELAYAMGSRDGSEETGKAMIAAMYAPKEKGAA